MNQDAPIEGNLNEVTMDGTTSQEDLDYTQLQQQSIMIPEEAVLQPAQSVQASQTWDATTISIAAGGVLVAAIAVIVLYRVLRKRRRGW